MFKMLLATLAAAAIFGGLTFTGDNQVTDVRDKIDFMKGQIVSVSNDRDKVLEKLESTVHKYDRDIEDLNTKKSDLESKIEDLMSQLSTSEEKNKELQAQIQQLQAEKEQLEAQIQQLQAEKQEAQAQIQQLQAEKEQLQNQLTQSNTDKDNELQRLANELQRANKKVADLDDHAIEVYNEILTIKTETNLDDYNTSVKPDLSDNIGDIPSGDTSNGTSGDTSNGTSGSTSNGNTNVVDGGTETFNIYRNNNSEMSIGGLTLKYDSNLNELSFTGAINPASNHVNGHTIEVEQHFNNNNNNNISVSSFTLKYGNSSIKKYNVFNNGLCQLKITETKENADGTTATTIYTVNINLNE